VCARPVAASGQGAGEHHRQARRWHGKPPLEPFVAGRKRALAAEHPADLGSNRGGSGRVFRRRRHAEERAAFRIEWLTLAGNHIDARRQRAQLADHMRRTAVVDASETRGQFER